MAENDPGIVRERLERAVEAFHEARDLADAGRPRQCLDRLYTACLYGATALLHHLGVGVQAEDHAKALALFNRHCVRAGLVPESSARAFQELFNRHAGGQAGLPADAAEDKLLALAAQLLGRVKGLVAGEGGAGDGGTGSAG